MKFSSYKEIEEGLGAKSYMTNGLLIYGEKFAHFLIYQFNSIYIIYSIYIRNPFLIYDFAPDPI